MKSVVMLHLGNDEIAANNLHMALEINTCGRGFVTALTEKDYTGQLVRLDLGYNTAVYRWFTGFVERSAPAENGSQRLFVRELTGVFERNWPCSLQHPTLRTVIDELGRNTNMRFILPVGTDYTDSPIPYFQHAGSGYPLLTNLGRAFNIPDFVWFQFPDGTVFVGSYADSRYARTPIDIPNEFSSGSEAGTTQTFPLIPAIRPGMQVNGRRISKILITDDEMSLTWTPVNKMGKPAQKSPERRQIDKLYPELSSGLHLPRLARVISPSDTAALGDEADPFRPRYAVNVQLLDENGNPASDIPEYKAVPLPVPLAGAEGGLFQYPAAGTLVEIGFADGRPDKPMIRQTLPAGQALPAIKPGEQLQQQRAGVSQRVTTEGSWQRQTDQEIQETSARRIITSDEESRTTTQRTATIQGNDSTTVIGTATLMAGAVIHISTGDYSQATSANMLIKCKNSTKEVEQNQKKQIGRDDEKTVGGALTEKIAGIRRSVAATHELIGSSVRLGSDSLNVLTLLTDILDVVDELAKASASHTHSNTGAPTNAGSMTAIAGKTRALAKKYGNFIG
ncbi:hypothetical protein [Photorhabdus tasmaniensis]|uniref:Gp5/Type VI secretion system Vgr protein OB-fold domain-containing protein n=1 Tax=Photorhabdus tasmaniensis TaxID=1004159 RepID=A0ABX0GG37_9GAMM|nr:hypothetical protein [Photorhabdus tasmaniensis]NHB87200.1 hypothetical protein [Photorhabdus tasmaniensis]